MKIESPEDLTPFQDLLEEEGWHEAAEAVAWLRENRRWPRKSRTRKTDPITYRWNFFLGNADAVLESKYCFKLNLRKVNANMGMVAAFNTPGEAIWFVIHAWPNRVKEST